MVLLKLKWKKGTGVLGLLDCLSVQVNVNEEKWNINCRLNRKESQTVLQVLWKHSLRGSNGDAITSGKVKLMRVLKAEMLPEVRQRSVLSPERGKDLSARGSNKSRRQMQCIALLVRMETILHCCQLLSPLLRRRSLVSYSIELHAFPNRLFVYIWRVTFLFWMSERSERYRLT